MAEPAYYGAPIEGGNSKSLRERLRDLYEPQDFVSVINIDTKPVKYQFANPADIETFSDYPGHKDTVQKRPPQVVTLQPGEKKLVPAYEADLMIETLVKQITTSRTQEKIELGEYAKNQSTNWNDPETVNNLISQIFLGKEDIIGSYNSSLQPKQSQAETDLLNEPSQPVRAKKAV